MLNQFKKFSRAAACVALMAAAASTSAAIITGDIFFTRFSGTPNVNKVTATYDNAAGTLGFSPVNPISTTPGADGIIFRPNGNLLIGGQGAAVYEVVPSTGAITTTYGTAGQASFHLTLDPGGSKVWTSPFGGPLVEVPFAGGSVAHPVSPAPSVVGDFGVTAIAFAPNGNVFYVNGQPNGGGNVGLINLTTFQTTRLHSGIASAHGMVYDPFSNRMVLFGAGFVGSFAIDGSDLRQFDVPGVNDFDQGAVDGSGHAFIAGSGAITLVDYAASGEITSPFRTIVGSSSSFFNIDDVAPLVGPGAPPPTGVPEPSSIALLGLGLAALMARRRRKQ